MKGDITLKPCPFCGCDEAGTRWHHGYWSVTCSYRHDGTPSEHCFQDWGEFQTEEEAVAAWNHRCELPNSPLTLEELQEMSEEPVWVEWNNGTGGCWMLAYYGYCENANYSAWSKDYGKLWVAYRRKP